METAATEYLYTKARKWLAKHTNWSKEKSRHYKAHPAQPACNNTKYTQLWTWHTLTLSPSLEHTHRYNLQKVFSPRGAAQSSDRMNVWMLIKKLMRPRETLEVTGFVELHKCQRSKESWGSQRTAANQDWAENQDQELRVKHVSWCVLHMYRPDLGQITIYIFLGLCFIPLQPLQVESAVTNLQIHLTLMQFAKITNRHCADVG